MQPKAIINFVGEVNEKTATQLFFILNNQLQAGNKDIRINLASPGGSVFHGITIHNFLAGLKGVNIHTHNLAQIDSVANVIFLAGKTRTANKVSTFFMHPPKAMFKGDQALSIHELKERHDGLKKDEEKLAEIIASHISKSPEEVLKMFQDRKVYSSVESKKLGFISSLEDFTAAPGIPIFTITNHA